MTTTKTIIDGRDISHFVESETWDTHGPTFSVRLRWGNETAATYFSLWGVKHAGQTRTLRLEGDGGIMKWCEYRVQYIGWNRHSTLPALTLNFQVLSPAEAELKRKQQTPIPHKEETTMKKQTTYTDHLLAKDKTEKELLAREWMTGDKFWALKSSFVCSHDGAAKVVLVRKAGLYEGTTATFEFPAPNITTKENSDD